MPRKAQPSDFIDDPLQYNNPDGPLVNARIGNEPWLIKLIGCRARVLLAIHMHSGAEFTKICEAAKLDVRVAQRSVAALVRWSLVAQHGRVVRITPLGSSAAQLVLRAFHEAKRQAGRATPATPTASTTGVPHDRPEETAA